VLQPALQTAFSSGSSIAVAAIAGKSLAVPVIGAAIAGVTLAIGLWMNRRGPKQKVYTTQIVNEAEPLLQQNLDAWNASNKTRSEQAQALQNFDQIWSAVVAACDRPELGNPGQACINDRKPGGRWDWAAYYRTPILNDANVTDDPISNAFAEISGIFGGDSTLPLLLAGGLLLWAVAS